MRRCSGLCESRPVGCTPIAVAGVLTEYASQLNSSSPVPITGTLMRRSLHTRPGILAVAVLLSPSLLESQERPNRPEAAIRPATLAGFEVARLIGADTMLMSVVRDSVSTPAGRQIDEVQMISTSRGPALQHVVRVERGASSVTDTNVYDPATLAAQRHVSSGGGRVFTLDYSDGTAVGRKVRANGDVEEFSARLDAPIFDASALDLVLRTLPLSDGYVARMTFFNHEKGNTISVRLEARSDSVLDASAKRVHAWRVTRTFEGDQAPPFVTWVASSTRRIVRMEMRPAPGIIVVGQRH